MTSYTKLVQNKEPKKTKETLYSKTGTESATKLTVQLHLCNKIGKNIIKDRWNVANLMPSWQTKIQKHHFVN